MGGGLTARFSAHLSVESSATLLVQWNTETNDLDLNLRLDFIHTPGSDLFVVYNESLNTAREDAEPRSNSRAGIVKLTYLFHF